MQFVTATGINNNLKFNIMDRLTLKTRKTAPKVVYTNHVLQTWQDNIEANKLCIKAVGQIILGMTGGNTGWHEDGRVFLSYDRKTNTLTADLFDKFKKQ